MFGVGHSANPKLLYSMTAPAIIISILFVLCLTSSVATRSAGLVTENDKPSQRWLVPIVFGVSQGLMALIGYYLGKLVSHLFIDEFASYLVFALMLVVAVKMFVDSMRILKGKMMYTVSSDWDYILLSIMAAFNTLLMSLTGFCFLPFGSLYLFVLAVAAAGFLWSCFIVRIPFEPKMLRKLSFIEFSASVFMVVIAILYLFTDLV